MVFGIRMIRKAFTFLSFFLVSLPFFGQQYVTTGDFDRISKASVGFGLNTYMGELRRFNDSNIQAGLSMSVGYEHLFTQNVAIRTSLSIYQIKAADSLSVIAERANRNLSFKATNVEFNVQAMYYMFPHPASGYKDRAFINPYVFAGAGFTSNNPKAELEGTLHRLRPLRTEGQDYGSLAVVIPVGAGLSFFVNRFVDIQFEFQYTMSLTGYLDDVSQVYRDPLSFGDPSDIGARLSDRRQEIGLTPAPAGSARGDQGNDSYLRVGFRVTYLLPKSLYGKSSIRCKVVKRTR